MARTFFSYIVTKTLGANPDSVLYVQAPANRAIVLKAIEVQPQGATAATAPIQFDVQKCTVAPTGSAATAIKAHPQGAEVVQTSAKDAITVEGTVTQELASFQIHQQGARNWVPQGGEMVIPGGEGRVIRALSSLTPAVKIQAYFEE